VFPSAGDELRVKPGGLVVALVGFGLTRSLLVAAVYGEGTPSLPVAMARLAPLVVGLGLVVYGINLAVGTRDRAYARTVAGWFLLGGVGMLLTVGFGLLGRPEPMVQLRTSNVVASAVVGGGVGGILVGIRSARARRRRRSLSRQADRAVLLNRLLRHEVLNALTAIRGHAGLLTDGSAAERSRSAIEDSVERIERTVDDVGFLVRTVDDAELAPVDPAAAIRRCLDGLSRDGAVTVDGDLPAVRVRADEQLDTVITELLGGALGDGERAGVTVGLGVDDTAVDLRVSAPGRWLDDAERAALLDGVPERETPDADYGLSLVHLLVDQYGGGIDVTDRDAGTVVTVELPRTSDRAPASGSPGVAPTELWNATLAGLGAGLAMGVIVQAISGNVAIIGALYGIRTAAVGWVTHLFHSVVFATVFVAAISLDRLRGQTGSLAGTVALGIGYGVSLWLLAAGVVMGVWLNLVGIPTMIPNLGTASLLGHVVWGALVGALVALLPTGRDR